MKLFYNLSKLKESTTFKHDAQLIQGVQIGIIVFLILSSTTVFSGVKSHMAEYLVDSFFLWRWFVNVCSYVVGSLGIDMVNTICLAYVVCAVLRKDFKMESIILIACCSLLSIGLSYYSFSMSQNSALVLGNDLKEENQKDDSQELSKIDTTLNNQLSAIERSHTENYNRAVAPFGKRISNIETTFSNQIAILQNEIAVIDANSTKENYLYAAKQKKPIINKIQALEVEKLAALSPVLTEQQTVIDALTAQKNNQIKSAQDFHKSDRNRATSKTDNHNSEVKATSSIFSDLFGKLAGYAVFALLLLTAIREILFFRNGIEPEPILSNFDFSPSWMIEVVSYPLVWTRRHSINKVRGWYAALPELKEPVVETDIWDGRSFNQEVIEPEPVEDFPDDELEGIPTGGQRYLRAGEYISASIPATSGADETSFKNNLSQYSHENEKNRGYQTHEDSTKSDFKIKHIGKNKKVYWYDKGQVEGKVKKYRANVREWTRKANRSKATDRDKKALENNERLLLYWMQRLTEF